VGGLSIRNLRMFNHTLLGKWLWRYGTEREVWWILTLDNLKKRHIIVIDRCYMCKKTGESVDHLFLHRDVASALWSSLFSRFGLS
jgi:hypothetical protein